MEKELDRKDFFKEVSKNFKDATKEIVIPLVEDDLEKMDNVIDGMFGLSWISIGKINPENFTGVKDYYLNKKSIAVYSIEGKIKAVDKSCPNCQSLVNYIAYDKKFKCFKCENEYLLDCKDESLKLKKLPVKQENDLWMIGLNK